MCVCVCPVYCHSSSSSYYSFLILLLLLLAVAAVAVGGWQAEGSGWVGAVAVFAVVGVHVAMVKAEV